MKRYSDFMDEISNAEIYKGLLANGLFSEKLPEQWTRQIGNLTIFLRNGIMDYIGARSYLDSAIEVMQNNKENSAILNYAIKAIPHKKLSRNSGDCLPISAVLRRAPAEAEH